MIDQWNWKYFVSVLKKGLGGALPSSQAHMHMMPSFRTAEMLVPSGDARESGVLILLYPQGKDVELVLIQRTADGGSHSGQIAFPGGKREQRDESIVATALRESQEEINLNISDVEILGRLSPLYIHVSNFIVYPTIAVCHQKPELQPSEWEVDKILYVNLNNLFKNKTVEKIIIPSLGPNIRLEAPVYKPEPNITVWGATAMILSELEFILNRQY
jgi:8-oxo-dGTP pyrophosphatase MutT (NUDIX family)